VVGVLCALLAACGGGDDTAAGSPPPAAGTTVALTVPSQGLNFSQETAEGFQSGVAAVDGVTARVVGPPVPDPQAQLELFRPVLDSSAGASVFTLAPDVFAEPLAAAARKGTPLVAVDNPPLPSAGVGLYIGNDNIALGRQLAQQIVAGLPAGTEGGTIVIGTAAAGAVVLQDRVTGMQQEFRRRIPDVTIKGPFETKLDVETNSTTWGSLIKGTPDALAFVGTGDADAISLGAWKEQTKGSWAAGGFDLEPAALLAAKRGDLTLVSPEHYLKGAVAGRLLAHEAKSGTPLPQGWLRTPGLTITKANVDEIINRQSSPATKASWFATQVEKLTETPATVPMPSF
jgi:ribose transport system substrate-binding protein